MERERLFEKNLMSNSQIWGFQSVISMACFALEAFNIASTSMGTYIVDDRHVSYWEAYVALELNRNWTYISHKVVGYWG